MAVNCEKSQRGTTINEWAQALVAGSPDLAWQLDEDKLIGLRGLERLNLPRLYSETFLLKQFLQDPGGHFQRIGSEKFYINLPPRREGLVRYRQIDLTEGEALQFIFEHVPEDQVTNYNIVISEFFKNEYGGNILVNDKGGVYMEAAQGNHAPLVSGAKTPEVIVERGKFTGVFHYSALKYDAVSNGLQREELEDEHLKVALWNTLQVIPHDQPDEEAGLVDKVTRNTMFTPGYYEFALVRKTSDGPLEPIFIDYRKNPAYQLT